MHIERCAKMKYALMLCGLSSLLVLPSVAADKCPACGGAVTTVGKVTDDKTKESKNLEVWDRSSCAFTGHDEDSVICTRCWCVEDRTEPTVWIRSSKLPNSFFIPLSKAIREFPAPKDSAGYEQRFEGEKRIESLSFWCTDAPDLIAKYQRYCKEHDLTLELDRSERYPKKVFVDVEQKPIAQQGGAGQPATRPESKSEDSDKPQTKSEGRSR